MAACLSLNVRYIVSLENARRPVTADGQLGTGHGMK
jgi:hypothetical protein